MVDRSHTRLREEFLDTVSFELITRTHKTRCFLTSMPKKFGTPRLLVLKDKRAQSRGYWVIYPSMPEIGFTACLEIQNERQETSTLEKIFLETDRETRSFCLDLIQNGWSINLGGAK